MLFIPKYVFTTMIYMCSYFLMTTLLLVGYIVISSTPKESSNFLLTPYIYTCVSKNQSIFNSSFKNLLIIMIFVM